ncbi:MAG: hypothetical protein Q9165_007962 [Trypethelium subeluteriae]
MEWVQAAGVAKDRLRVTKNRGFLTFDATVGELENLLKAEYFVYQHTKGSDHHAIACDRYHIPHHLQQHIGFITPGTSLGASKGRRQNVRSYRKRQECSSLPSVNSPTLDTCWQAATPECLNVLYDIPTHTDKHAENTFGIFEIGHSFSQPEMDLFFEHVAPNIPVGTMPKNNWINGPPSTDLTSEYVMEANLDFQLAWPMVYPQNISLYASTLTAAQNFSDSSAPLGALLHDSIDDLLRAIDKSYCSDPTDSGCGIFEAPKVLSISFGATETDVSQARSTRLCNE